MAVDTHQGLAAAAVELYRMVAGTPLTEAEATALGAILAKGDDGTWLEHSDWFGSRVLEARALAGLFILDERIVWSTPSYPLAREAFRRLREMIDGADSLRLQVKHLTAARGVERIDFRNGGCVLFVGRGSRAVRGFAADVVLVDGADGPSASLELLPCLARRPNGQLVVNRG